MARAPWERKFSFGTRGLYEAGVVFGPLAAAAPFISMAATAAGAGMSILSATSAANGQRAAGNAAYENAVIRQQQGEQQAEQMQVAAGQQQAASQRQAIVDTQKAKLMAGRAKAVMAASGAGEDPNLIAGLLGQGTYNANTDLYGGDEKARSLNNQAAMTRWSGNAGIGVGA